CCCGSPLPLRYPLPRAHERRRHRWAGPSQPRAVSRPATSPASAHGVVATSDQKANGHSGPRP
ncbi:MAG: hypothetical protein ABI243_03775, partial [Lapillicoccus sp.]